MSDVEIKQMLEAARLLGYRQGLKAGKKIRWQVMGNGRKGAKEALRRAGLSLPRGRK